MKKYYKNSIYTVFLLPALILFTMFLIAPAFVMLPISFQNNNSIMNLGWVGWENYKAVFSDKTFWMSQINILKLLLLTLISMPLSWLLAFALDRTSGWVSTVFRFAALVPLILAITSVAKLFQGIYNANWGLVNSILKAIGLGALQHSWLSSKDTAIWCIGICNVWCGLGAGVIIKCAALRGVPKNYVEAAMLDGCTAASADWKIRLPLLRNIIQYDLITGVIGTLCIYALIEVISVTYAKYTTVPMLEIVNTSMKKLQFGLGCAMAVVFFIECLVVSIILHKSTDWENIEY